MRRQVIVSTLLIAVTGLALGAAPAKTANKAVVIKHRPKSVTDYVLHGASDATKKSTKDLLRIIEGLRYLIANGKSDAQRSDLLLSRASAALAVARNYRLQPTKDGKSAIAEKKYLVMAKDDAENVMKIQNVRAADKSKAMYFSGLSMIYQGDSTGAQKRFIDAIAFNPKSEYAPMMSILVAEQSFDQEKYAEAINQYRMFFNRLTAMQKVIAIYKTAWCQVNLRDFESAEKNFLRLAANKSAGAFAEDSKRDMAYVMIEHRDERGILAFTATEFTQQPSLRADVLTEAYKIYQAQSGTVRHPLIFNELMRIETDPAKRLRIVISNIRAQQRQFASMEPFREYLDMRQRMKEMSVGADSEIFAKVSTELEVEMKALIHAFADTFINRVKTPENIPNKDLGNHLVELLAFHIQYYPKSEDRVTSYSVWMDVCNQLQDYKCQYDVSRRILGDKTLEKLKRRASLELIAGLEGLQKNDKKFRAEFVDTMAAFCKDNPEDKEWLRVAKRLTGVMGEDKAYDASLPWLEKIDSKEHNSESHFRLVWTHFQAGHFEQVAETKGPFANDKLGKDTAELVRESHLRVAQQKIEKNDFSGYEKHIQGYLANNPDESKRAMVQRDYMNRLLDRGNIEQVGGMLLPLPAKTRFIGTYEPVTNRVIDEYVKRGEFEKADEVLKKGATFGQFKNAEAEWMQVNIGVGRELSSQEVLRLSKSDTNNRKYILGLLALTRPASAITYFSEINAAASPEKRLLFLAHQVKADHWEVNLDTRTLAILGDIVPKELRSTGITKSEKRIGEITFPSQRASVERYSKMAQDVVVRTKALRKPTIKELESKLPSVQIRILTASMNLEDKVAQMINESPLPKGLDEKQVDEYKAGIGKLAKEFSDQASEYAKLRNQIQEKSGQREPGSEISVHEMSDPSTDAAKPVNVLIEKKNFPGAMLALDRWKKMGQIQDPDYYALRAKILLSERDSDFMKEYVRRELTSAKQEDLLNHWKKPVQAPPPSQPQQAEKPEKSEKEDK